MSCSTRSLNELIVAAKQLSASAILRPMDVPVRFVPDIDGSRNLARGAHRALRSLYNVLKDGPARTRRDRKTGMPIQPSAPSRRWQGRRAWQWEGLAERSPVC